MPDDRSPANGHEPTPEAVQVKFEDEATDPSPMAIRQVPEPPEVIWQDGVEYRRVHGSSGAAALDRLQSPEVEQRQRIRLFDRQNGRCYHCNDLITERGKGVRVAVEVSEGVLICQRCAHPERVR